MSESKTRAWTVTGLFAVIAVVTVGLGLHAQGKQPSGGPMGPDSPIAKGYNDAAKAYAAVDDNPMIKWEYRIWCVTGYRDATPDDKAGGFVDALADPNDVMTPGGWIVSHGRPIGVQFMDNAWYVGNDFLGSVIVRAPEGLLMFDTMSNPEEAETLIIPQMKKFGLDPADIKYIFLGHQHGDHIGGANLIRTKYAPGAKIVAGKPDAEAIAAARARINAGEVAPGRGGRGGAPAVPAAPLTPSQLAAQKAARLLLLPDPIDIQVDAYPGTANGMRKIVIGTTTVTVALTPGHTIGQIAAIVPVVWKGQPHKLAVWSGNDANFPDVVPQYALSASFFRTIAEMEGADATINTHAYQGDDYKLLRKMAADPTMSNPFILGTAGVSRFYGVFAECNKALAQRGRDGTWKKM